MAGLVNKLLVAIVICAAWLIRDNEAGRVSMSTSAKATMRLKMMWKADKARNAESLASMRTGMTVERAMGIMPRVSGSNDEFIGLIQENLGTTVRTTANKTKLRRRLVKSHGGPGGSAGNSDSHYTGGPNVALARINDMMLETIEKHDAEDIRCHDFNASQLIILQEIEEDRKILETLGEAASGAKTSAYAEKGKYQDKVDTQRSEIGKWTTQCGIEKGELQTQYNVAAGDRGVMLEVIDMVNCENPVQLLQTGKQQQGSAPAQPVVVLTCQNTETGKTYEKLSIRDEKMRHAFAQMKHPKVVQLLKETLGQDPGDGFAYSTYGNLNATVTPSPEMAAEKCSLDKSPKCNDLRERFLNIQGGIEDTVTQIEHFISNHDLRCTHVEETMAAELSLYIESVDRYTVLEKKALETKGEYDLQKQEKTRQYEQTSGELSDELTKCHQMIKELTEEHCALEEIRGQLMNMESIADSVTDCDVTEWEPEECTVTCGGGTRFLTRMITVHTDGGHHCPALKAQQDCNTQRCPLDCEVEDWSGWGPCSAFCNGGVEERLRKIVVHNTPGGDVCPQTSETNECNLDACDANCELWDWSAWTPTCNKVCGGGRVTRFKHLKTAERGDGTCAAFHDPERFNAKACNTQPCTFDLTKQMVCDTKLDVILLLDGSGSMGTAAFEVQRTAAIKIVRSMGKNVNIGALQFGGPMVGRADYPEWSPQYKNWWLCNGHEWALQNWGWKSSNPGDVCGMKWAAELSNDTASIETQLLAAPYLGAHYTFTHTGLDLAGQELRFGRGDAQSIVIVLTDGVPTLPTRTIASAHHLMKQARVMWVPVGLAGASLDGFDYVASDPVKDNVIDIRDVMDMDSTANVDKIISNFCPVISYVETTTPAPGR